MHRPHFNAEFYLGGLYVGAEAKEKIVYLKWTSNFGPLQ